MFTCTLADSCKHTCCTKRKGPDPFEHHRLHTEHAAPSVRVGYHHGVFQLQSDATDINGHMASALHDESVHRVQSGFDRFERSKYHIVQYVFYPMTYNV